MAYDLQVGTSGLRAEVVDSMVKQVAEATYKFKQAVAIVPTNAWKNTFFREDTTIPEGKSGNATKGVPMGANFPQASLSWNEISVRIVKHALEENIPYEVLLASEINVQARTVIRLTEGVVKSVDDDIWDALTENRNPSNIQSFSIGTVAEGGHWDESSAAIVDNIMHASRLISNYNYDVGDLICFISPYMKQKVVKFLIDKGSQFNSIAAETVRNGQIGKLANVTFVESNSVTASYALVVKPKTCATFKQLVPLTSNVTEDPLKSWRLRVVEEGVVELTDPKAVVLIKDVQGQPAT